MDVDMIVVMVSLQKLRYFGCIVNIERPELENTREWSFSPDFDSLRGPHCRPATHVSICNGYLSILYPLSPKLTLSEPFSSGENTCGANRSHIIYRNAEPRAPDGVSNPSLARHRCSCVTAVPVAVIHLGKGSVPSRRDLSATRAFIKNLNIRLLATKEDSKCKI